MTRRGYREVRGPDVSFIPHNGNPFGGFPFATTHSGPFDFLQEIPLVLYGPGFIANEGEISVEREVTLADIVPTIAELLGADLPPGAIGKPIHEALLPRRERSRDLRLVMVVVWDGGGTNVLERWRDSTPYLRSLMERGTSIANAVAGTSPTVTPAIHATIGTGAWPRRHGIVNIQQRDDYGNVTYGFGIESPSLEPTLADTYDLATGNRALIGAVVKEAMHLPMLGHGSSIAGGDADIAVMVGSGEEGFGVLDTLEWFRVPGYVNALLPQLEGTIRRVDTDDGALDGLWMDHELPTTDSTKFGPNPVMTLFQTEVTKSIIANEGFGDDATADIFLTNYKEIDLVGHSFNFYSDEEASVLEYTDSELKQLTRYLDREVGRKRWAMIVTADHGQSPEPEAAGTWPIDVRLLTTSLNGFVGGEIKAVQHIKQNGVWLDPDVLAAQGVSLGDVSRFLMSLTIGDNAEGRRFPKSYRQRFDEPLFDTAFPSSALPKLIECTAGG